MQSSSIAVDSLLQTVNKSAAEAFEILELISPIRLLQVGSGCAGRGKSEI